MLALFAAAAVAWPAPLRLSYQGRPGEVLHYQVSFSVRGTQVALGESRPVRLQGRMELVQKTLSVSKNGEITFQVTAQDLHLEQVKGETSSLLLPPSSLPEMVFTIAPTGQLLSARTARDPAGLAKELGLYTVAEQLLSAARWLIFPDQELQAGAQWESEQLGAKIKAKLLGFASRRGHRLARLELHTQHPLSLHLPPNGLGREVSLQGQVQEETAASFDITLGGLVEETGRQHLQAETTVLMTTADLSAEASAKAEGQKSFASSLDLSTSFTSRLVRVEHKPQAGARGS